VPRPCLCGGCRRCTLYLTNPKYTALWDGTPAPADTPAARVAPPCAHLGAPLTGPERAARKLSHARPWRWCLHAGQPLGEAACSCRGCGPKCPGYARQASPPPTVPPC
jgi:hypothetical protein